MEVYRVGRIIQEERKRRNISQEDLCSGICVVSTLSRIENGTQKPTLKMEKALLERLGCSTENLTFYAGKDEVKKHELEIELTRLTMHRDSVEEKLTLYKELTAGKKMSHMEKQFILMIEAMHGSYSGEWELAKVQEQLEEALRLTIPNFAEKELEKVKCMTMTEITILNNLGIVKHKQEQTMEAMRIWYYLLNYLENSGLSVDTVGKKYPVLLVNLTKIALEMHSFEEMLTLCNKGIHFCKQYERMVNLAELYYYKAVALVKLGHREDAKECYEYAICLAKINNREKIAHQVKQEYAGLFIDNYSYSPNQQFQSEDRQHTNPLQEQ